MVQYDWNKLNNDKQFMELVSLDSKSSDLFNELIHKLNIPYGELSKIIDNRNYKPDNPNFNEFEQVRSIDADYNAKFDAFLSSHDIEEEELQNIIDSFEA